MSSLATVHEHLTNLEAKGLIRRTWNHSRAIELVPQRGASGAVDLPLLGRVAAGQPIEALENADHIAVPEQFIRRQNTFVLKVVGDSMVQDGILDGDYIVVEERPRADDGETVVAVVAGEATVKRFYRDRPGRIRLQPANDAMAPLLVQEKELRGPRRRRGGAAQVLTGARRRMAEGALTAAAAFAGLRIRSHPGRPVGLDAHAAGCDA